MMLAKLTLSTLFTPGFVPRSGSQYAGSFNPLGPVCGPGVTPGGRVGVTSGPVVVGAGVVGTVAAGGVAAGEPGLAGRCSKPGIKRTPTLNTSASARTIAPITT